ncbi:60S ribosomal protein l13-1 [Phtheirospermum japonicum]|uniref:60S ribosomal protein l13-1 n=1 Tax=Phtheirospermum japonicum TaxID=374723 RepID=A0A830CKI4_9LAMI|nr:60S ribosomal protein l13-1 [Phtheirospermum japonicum]
MKIKTAKGFSLEKLKAARIPKKLGLTIGIFVNHHCRNRFLEGLHTNVQRLKLYKAKVIVFSGYERKIKNGDSTLEELAITTQVSCAFLSSVPEKPTVDLVKVTYELKSIKACNKLHLERTNACYVGVRAQRATDAENE